MLESVFGLLISCWSPGGLGRCGRGGPGGVVGIVVVVVVLMVHAAVVGDYGRRAGVLGSCALR